MEVVGGCLHGPRSARLVVGNRNASSGHRYARASRLPGEASMESSSIRTRAALALLAIFLVSGTAIAVRLVNHHDAQRRLRRAARPARPGGRAPRRPRGMRMGGSAEVRGAKAVAATFEDRREADQEPSARSEYVTGYADERFRVNRRSLRCLPVRGLVRWDSPGGVQCDCCPAMRAQSSSAPHRDGRESVALRSTIFRAHAWARTLGHTDVLRAPDRAYTGTTPEETSHE